MALRIWHRAIRTRVWDGAGLALLMLTLFAVACAPSKVAAPEQDARGSWLAELRAQQQLLFMTLSGTGDARSGTAKLSQVSNVGAEDLAVAGLFRGDSLTLTFSRSGVPAFAFRGRYTAPIAITGVLSGGGYLNTSVTFLRQ